MASNKHRYHHQHWPGLGLAREPRLLGTLSYTGRNRMLPAVMDITPIVACVRNYPGSGFTNHILGPAPEGFQRENKQALAALRRRR